MSFLKNFEKEQNANIHSNWQELTSIEQLEQIIKNSQEKPIGIFKHSTRCGISVRAKMVLEEDWSYNEKELDFYYLDLLKYRDVSNKVAELTGVHHQSPQVIILKDEEPVYEETHHAINAKELGEYL